MMRIINQAAEKFKNMQAELCEFLFGMLREINVLEREFVARDKKLFEEKRFSETREMFAEYRECYGAIVKEKCTEKLLSKPYGMSLNSEILYAFAEEDFEGIDGKGCTVTFEMNAPKRAVIEARYKRSSQERADKFTLIKQGDKWLVDAHNWWSEYDFVWHRGNI